MKNAGKILSFKALGKDFEITFDMDAQERFEDKIAEIEGKRYSFLSFATGCVGGDYPTIRVIKSLIWAGLVDRTITFEQSETIVQDLGAGSAFQIVVDAFQKSNGDDVGNEKKKEAPAP